MRLDAARAAKTYYGVGDISSEIWEMHFKIHYGLRSDQKKSDVSNNPGSFIVACRMFRPNGIDQIALQAVASCRKKAW
jgi:hypothetical protein